MRNDDDDDGTGGGERGGRGAWGCSGEVHTKNVMLFSRVCPVGGVRRLGDMLCCSSGSVGHEIMDSGSDSYVSVFFLATRKEHILVQHAAYVQQ